MIENPSGDLQTPGTTRRGGLILTNTSDACPACDRALSTHEVEVRAAGVVTLAPCGVDVSGVPARQLVDAIGSETESATPTLIP